MFLLSRLIQPRGLKYILEHTEAANNSRGLYSLVDWNDAGDSDGKRSEVEAYTASWIEISVLVAFSLRSLVEAYTASWIEILWYGLIVEGLQSRLIQPRGLKCGRLYRTSVWYSVEAYTASWIEICLLPLAIMLCKVEAYTASWIEIKISHAASTGRSRGLYSLVDWNLHCIKQRRIAHQSRLIQPRGLKFFYGWVFPIHHGRGLYSLVDWNTKYMRETNRTDSRGLYSLVDWNIKLASYLKKATVEAYTASWIEIKAPYAIIRPMEGRGLYSLVDWNAAFPSDIYPRIMSRLIQPRGLKYIPAYRKHLRFRSRLIQPRGLKYTWMRKSKIVAESRLIQPRGLKYWIPAIGILRKIVEAYTASWIEMSLICFDTLHSKGRGLYSLVDWNNVRLLPPNIFYVEAYVASWIEIPSPLL